MDEKAIGLRVHQHLVKKGMTMTELAEKINVSQSTVSLWLSGRRKLNYTYTKKIADVIGINEIDIFFDKIDILRSHLGSYCQKFNIDISAIDDLIIVDEELSIKFYEALKERVDISKAFDKSIFIKEEIDK